MRGRPLIDVLAEDPDIERFANDASRRGAALASLRRRTTAVCEVCGAAFETWARKSQQARTCSNTCRQALFRREQKQAAE